MAKYPTFEAFRSDYDIIRKQADFMPQNAENCFGGFSPSIYTLQRTYGNEAVDMWLADLITYITNMVGCRDKLFAPQIVFIVRLFKDKGYIKASELLLFVNKYIGGDYGKVYGSLDTQTIGTAFREFMQERADAHSRLEFRQKQEEQKRLEQEQPTLTFAEYKARMEAQGKSVPDITAILKSV